MNPLSGLGKRFGSYLYNYHQDQLRPVPTDELMSLLAQMENAKPSASADLSEPIGMAIDAATPIKGVAGILAGPKAKGADMAKLTIAELWDKWGRSAKEIWDETGWFKDAAGNWRWEIPDFGFRIKEPPKSGAYAEGVFEDLAEHPGLLDAYPSFSKGVVSSYPMQGLGEYHGLTATDKIPIIGHRPGLGESERAGVVLHEMQHAADDIEGYLSQATGGLPRHLWELVPSENVAEAVRMRRHYGPTLRERIPTLDMMVPLEKQR